MNNPRQDLLGRTPKIGDLIAFNPPRYKGILIGRVVEFTPAALPKCYVKGHVNVNLRIKFDNMHYAPTTGFVIVEEMK